METEESLFDGSSCSDISTSSRAFNLFFELASSSADLDAAILNALRAKVEAGDSLSSSDIIELLGSEGVESVED